MEADLERHASLDDRFDPAIRIVDYGAEWPREFEREARAIQEALGDLVVRIEHGGSTSVPGLASKPIVDTLVSVERIEPREIYVRALERLGYLFAFNPDLHDNHFFGKPVKRPRRYHVRVCQAGSSHERRHLAVRDYLRAHLDEAERYATLRGRR
jgi:GrpB-like predicted nucleotidyltransferase (UPF0157 family)